jgi:RimJ/RimL family protein N-acetyltransferase
VLQEAADLGLLMSLRDDQGFAGLAAATISPLFGRLSLCMLDIFLTERLRGRGLAATVQSSFLAGQRSGADTVWGHIHAENQSSLRTAQKLGRRAVQQEYFVSLSAH